jgi:hypothetical protein
MLYQVSGILAYGLKGGELYIVTATTEQAVAYFKGLYQI